MNIKQLLIVLGVAAAGALFFFVVAGSEPSGESVVIASNSENPDAGAAAGADSPRELPFVEYQPGAAVAAAPGGSGVEGSVSGQPSPAPPFSTAHPIILENGREVPQGVPLGEVLVGSARLPVHHSSIQFFRPTSETKRDSAKTVVRGKMEIREIPVGKTALTAEKREAEVADLQAKGYAPALVLPTGERLIPTGELNILPEASVAASSVLDAIQALGYELVRQGTRSDPWWLIRTNSSLPIDVLKAANAFAARIPSQAAEPNWIREVKRRYVATDPYFKNQWHLRNTGQTAGTTGADIAADPAWDITPGNPQVIVAVFDDGFDIGHTDLPPATALVHSRDFVRGTTNPTPADVDPLEPDDHGTPVWGLIAAPHNNNKGVAGVAPGVKSMLLRSPMELDERGIADAIRWAADKGAHVMSNSWGYSNPGSVVTSALAYARSSGRGGKGTLVLFASGNENADIGVTNDLSNNQYVLAIGATTDQDRRTTYSNFGDRLFAVAPAGYGAAVGLVSTDRRASAGYTTTSYTNEVGKQFDGTSGACPIAAGIAGLVFSVYPDFTAAQVADILKETADKVQVGTAAYDAAGHSKKYGFGRLNAKAAIDRARVVAGTSGGGTAPPATNVLFEENFESTIDGQKSVSGKWSLVPTGATGSVFEVATVSGNKYLKALNTQGVATWKTSPVSISGQSNVTIKIKFAEIGTMEASDMVEGYYQIDGKTPVKWFSHADDAGSTFLEKTVDGLSGTSMTVWIDFQNGASEEWRLDDIAVLGASGSAPAPPPVSGDGIYREDFEGLSDGVTSVSGKWSLTPTGASGEVFQVNTVSGNKYLKALNTQGVATWRSSSISLAGRSNVGLRIRVAEVGTLEETDYIEGYYQIDGGTPVKWFSHFDDLGSTFQEFSAAGLSGSNLVIWVNVSNGSSEEWRIDDIEVTGTPAVSGYAAARSARGRVIVKENFSSRELGATSVEDQWKASANSGNLRVEKSRARKFLGGSGLAGGGKWQTEPANIKGLKDVTISLRLAEVGTMEQDDWVKAYFRIDGGKQVLWFEHHGQIEDGPEGIEKTVSGLSGNAIEVIVEFRNNAKDEMWRIDNFSITGAP